MENKNLEECEPLNDRNERLEYVGDITLNLEYWDCDCENNFIHSVKQQKCEVCGYEQEECPPSRENEVQIFFEKGILPGRFNANLITPQNIANARICVKHYETDININA